MVLALVMVVSMFPAAALAVDTVPAEPPSVIDLTQNLYVDEDNIVSDEELEGILSRVEPVQETEIALRSTPVIEAAWRLFAATNTAADFANYYDVAARQLQPTGGIQTAPRLEFWEINPPGTGTPARRELASSFRGAGAGNGFVGLANAMWYQTSISTVGLEDIEVTWAMRTTSTGPRDFELQYSTVGGANPSDWNSFTGGAFNLAVPASGTNDLVNEGNHYRVMLPSSVDNEATLFLRWIMTSNYSARAGTGTWPANDPIQTAGTLTMGGITIRSGVLRVIPIAEANDMANGAIVPAQRVTIEGYAVGVLQNLNGTPDNSRLLVQDGTGTSDGIVVGGPGVNLGGYVNEWVRVTGYRTADGGMNRIQTHITGGNPASTESSINIVPAAGRLPFTPTELTLSQLTPPGFRAMLVSMERVQVLEIPAAGAAPTGGGGNNAVLVGLPSGQRIELRLPGGVPLSTATAASGWVEVERAYVGWNATRNAVQLVNATVSATTAPGPTISVGTQTGALTVGTGGSATFQVTTALIDTGYSIALNNVNSVPGITMDTATVAGGTQTITIHTTNATPAGEHPLTLSVATTADGTVTSAQFDLVVTAPISIEAARATVGSGDRVTVEGHITGSQAASVAFMQATYADATTPHAGILVQVTGAGGLTGQHVRVTGYVHTVSGHLRLSASSTSGTVAVTPQVINSTVAQIAPIPVPLAQVTGTNFQGMMVSIVEPVRILNRAGDVLLAHPIDGSSAVLRMNFGSPNLAAFADIQSGSRAYVNRAHVYTFNAEHRIYSTAFNPAPVLAMTGIGNAERLTRIAAPVAPVTANPASGSTVTPGGVVTFSTAPAVAQIQWRFPSDLTWTTGPNPVDVTVPANAFDSVTEFAIEARGVLPSSHPDYPYESWPQTFTYTQAAVANVVPDRESGRISVGATLTLTTATPDASIYFTIVQNPGTPAEIVLMNDVPYVDGIVITNAMFRPSQDDTLQIIAWAVASGMTDSAELVLDFVEHIRGNEQIFFGQLHAHSLMSDCHRRITPEAAFAEARDRAGLDFFALTDHSNYFNWAPVRPGSPTLSGPGDTPESATNPNGFNLNNYNKDRWYVDGWLAPIVSGPADDPRQNGLPNYQWERGNRAAREATTANFIGINGFEFTWSGGPGHMNTFNTTGWVDRRNSYLNVGGNQDLRLLRYYELLRNSPESVSMFNHPGTTFGNFNNFAHFCPETALRIPLIEAANGESAIGTSGYFPAFEQYIMALDRGWLVAPVNSQDNHRGNFGWSNEGRVAIHTNDFTYDGMWQAFRDRNAYFTEIRDIEINYTAHFAGSHPDGEMMGSIIQHRPSEVRFEIEAYIPEIPRTVQQGIPNPVTRDSYTITRMELVTNGGVVLTDHVWTGNVLVGNEATHTVTLNNPEPGYYFLRVIAVNSRGQQRTNMTAPIWIGRSVTPLVGISEVTSDTFMPVTTEELTLTAHFFNDQSYPVTVEALEWTRNGVVYATLAPGLVIPAGDSAQVETFDYTPAGMGNVNFTVRAIMSADPWGANREYHGFIDLFVRDITRVGFVGIDGVHFNDYVTGTLQTGSFTNFARMAADHDLVTVIFQDEADIVAAAADERFQLFIFSSPGRHANILTHPAMGDHRNFSPATIAAVGNFVERGGTLAVAGHGNFNNSGAQNQALESSQAYQLNQLLVAAGSNIRIGDASHTAPVGYRDGDAHQHNLRFRNNFNLSNPFMDGVLYHGSTAHPEGQLYRNFSTGALYVVDDSDIIPRSEADVTNHVLSGDVDWDALGVDPMVLSHPGSWTIDSNRGAGRGKFPAPWTIGTNHDANPDGSGGSFPRYYHPELGVQANPGNTGGSGATLVAGQRPLHGGTADGQHLIAASQFVNANGGAVLAFASNFFSNFDIRPDLDFYGQVPPNMNFNIAQSLIEGAAPTPVITSIADVWAMEPGEWVTIQGVLTSGMRGSEIVGHFNSNSVYIQDESGRGINLFEVINNAPGMEIGQTWRATGQISYYQGERQLVVHIPGGSMRRITAEHVDVAPTPVTVLEAASVDTRGTLVSIQGIATDISPAGFTVTDAPGNSILVHIGSGVANAELSWLQEGMAVEVVGFSSIGTVSTENVPRIRVRDRAEITGIDAFVGPQVGTIQAGQSGEVTFTVTTSQDIPAGSIITVAGLPVGLELVGMPTVDASGVTTITIQTTGSGPVAGNFDLELVITDPTTGDEWSVPFTLAVEPPQGPGHPGGGGGIGTPDPDQPWFVDVAYGRWYYDYIRMVFEHNIMIGTSDTHFEPGRNFTRAMAVATLYRIYHGETAADLPYEDTRALFDDVREGAWYAPYVAWAYDEGIVLGVGESRFAPGDYVTREQLATMKHRFIMEMTDLDVDVEAGAQWANFADRGQISDWAVDAMIWANYHELIQGTSATTLDPLGNANRAQVAAILARAVGVFALLS